VLSILSAGIAALGAENSVYYPAGYRAWTVTKFKFIGPENPNYETQGGLRHHYANDRALASWGRFRDGAVIVDARVHVKLDGQNIWQEEGIAHVAVMRKDEKRRPDTGGWYFNIFSANDATVGMTPAQAKERCFDACHKAQAARDYVFSDQRR
jgi:hypothetical protein